MAKYTAHRIQGSTWTSRRPLGAGGGSGRILPASACRVLRLSVCHRTTRHPLLPTDSDAPHTPPCSFVWDLQGRKRDGSCVDGYVFRSYDLARMSRDVSCTRAGSWTKPPTFASSEKPLVAGLNTDNRLKLQLRQLSEEEELSSTRKYDDKTEQNNSSYSDVWRRAAREGFRCFTESPGRRWVEENTTGFLESLSSEQKYDLTV